MSQAEEIKRNPHLDQLWQNHRTPEKKDLRIRQRGEKNSSICKRKTVKLEMEAQRQNILNQWEKLTVYMESCTQRRYLSRIKVKYLFQMNRNSGPQTVTEGISIEVNFSSESVNPSIDQTWRNFYRSTLAENK